MSTDAGTLAATMAHAKAAHDRLLTTVAALRPADIGQPSLLPGWTRGHVLSHLARNADSHRHLIDGADRGEEVEQYPGGREARSADIEAGAVRSPAPIVEDVRVAGWWLEDRWAEIEPGSPVWDRPCRITSGIVVPARELPGRRWREVEVHHGDLGAPGFGWVDWSEEFVMAELPGAVGGLGARLDGIPGLRVEATDLDRAWKGGDYGAKDALVVRRTAHELLAWLYCRLDATRNGLPVLGPWG